MEDIKRYSFIAISGGFREYEDESGGWVKYEDIEELIEWAEKQAQKQAV